MREIEVFFDGGWRIGSAFTLLSSTLSDHVRFEIRFPS
jgi:hypothetical protein